ncbi:hypothetical protein BZA77DRAFT_366354 [Pyronema omphalodes]|nr:hypothetical protein BZA77DRAFT_366354 [Pyronema omphalodes]
MAATPLRSSHTLSSSPLLSPSAIIATLPAKAPKTPAIPRADSLNRSTSIWDVPESDEDPVLEELPKKQPRKRAVKATTTEKKPRARKKDATLSVATNKDVRDGVKSKYFSGGVAEALEALGESLDIIPPAETAEPKPKTFRYPRHPRRREWTPVLDTLPEPTETPLHTDADNVPPTDTPITSFGNKIGALRFSTSVSDSTSMPTELRPLVLKKRPIETSVSGKEKAATSTAGATKKRKNEEETTLVSPNTARQRLDRQEFVFGTLSQLEKQTVEDEEVLSPPQIQQEAEPVPGGTINRVVTASGGLWDAAGYRDPVNAINDAPAAENLENTCAAEHPQREPTPTLPDAPPVNPHPKPSDKPKPAVSKSPCGWNIPPPIFSSQPSAKRAFTTTASPEARRAKSSSPSGDQSFEAPPPSSPPPQIASKLVEPGEETAVAVVTPKRRNRVQKLVLEAVEGEAVASDTPAPKPRSRSQSRKLVPEVIEEDAAAAATPSPKPRGRPRKVIAEAVKEDAVADTPVPKPRSRSRKVAVEVVDVLEAPVAPVAPLTSDSVEQLPMSPSPSKRRTRSPSETPVAKRRSVSRAATPMEAASVLDAEPTKLVSIPNIEKQKAEVLVDSEPVPAKKPRSRTKKAVMSEEPVTTPKASGLPDKNALDTELVPVVEIPASPEPEIIVSPRKRRSVSPSESSPAKRKAKSRAKTPVETTEPEMVAERLSTPDIDDYLPKRAASVQPVVTKETTLDIDDLLPQSKKTRKPRSASALPGSASKKATTPDIDDILQSVKKPAVRKSRAKVPSGSPSRTRTPSRTRSRSRSIVSETEVETATKTKAKRTPRVRKSRSRSVIPETDHEDNALSSPETTRKRTRRKSRSKSPKRSPRKKTVKRTPKLKPLAKELEEDLFKRIGAEVKKDKTPGGWFERILMYDPIVVEELVDWLKERGVVRVLGGEVEEPEAPKKKGRGKAKAKDIEPEVEEPVKEPVAPIDEDVRAWCYYAGVCCVDTLTNGGKTRKRL